MPPILSTISRLSGLAVYLLLFSGLLYVFWVGFIASDDAIYAEAAYGWLTHFPYIGGLGTNRYPLVLPIALSFWILGGKVFTLVLPTLLYALGMTALMIRLMQKVDRAGGGVWPALLLITCPLLVIQSTIASVDVTQSFFQFASFLAYYAALRGKNRAALLIVSGAFTGLACLSKETAIFMAVFYGILFLAGYGMPRKYYWCIFLGFAAVWITEIIYLYSVTGDPMYRINQSLHHRGENPPAEDFGNIHIHPLIDPILILLLNQEFMFVFWASLPAAAYVFGARGWRDEANSMARLLILLGLVIILCSFALPSLIPPVPRYYMTPLIAFALATGLALSHISASGGRLRYAAISIGGFLILTNLSGLYLENLDIIFGEEELAATAATHSEPIYTDPATAGRAKLLLRWNGSEDRVHGEAPPPGALYLFNPARVSASAFNPRQFVSQSDINAFMPKPGWQEIRRAGPPQKWAGVILEELGLEKYIPAKLWKALGHGKPGTILYRTAA